MTKHVDTVYKEIGKRINAARTKQRMTQEVLAAKSGVAAAHIGFIEQGRRYPTVSTLCKLADALGVTLEQLFKDL
jgi:transcriptional regulator with XRE-family HTH domain